MIEWPINLLEAVQRTFVDDNVTIETVEQLLDIFKTQKELLSTDFFGALLPQQPGLLAILTLIGILFFVSLILLLVFCVARFLQIGGCGLNVLYQINHQEVCVYYGVKPNLLIKKNSENRSVFFSLVSGFGIQWLLIALCTAFIVSCTLNLSGGRNNIAPAEDVPVDVRQINKTSLRPVKIGLQSNSISKVGHSDHVPIGESDLLNKYNLVRELGYEFRPLEKDSDFRIQVVVFTFTAILFVSLLAVSGITVILGCREFLAQKFYHPMDRSNSSNCCGRALVACGFILLVLVPTMLFFFGILFGYVQAHNALCPFVQAQSQNQNMEDFLNSNFEIFDPYNLLDFLNDLQSERADINKFNCETYTRPLKGILFALIFLSIIALPMAFVILRLSKYFLRMKTQFYWNQTAETYTTLPREKKAPLPSPPYNSVFSAPRY
ncbi:hypothetical protein M3Y96_01091400 [Aphelenchoides besseyi]|nr:hypothetical protein M3Y96_01091400 [Aphelenchoides besseyi]